jgi:PAS domain S-box-containing protein
MVHGAGEVQYDHNGTAFEVIGIVQDLTERKQVEAMLRESESKYRSILETAYDPIVIVNSMGKIEFANHQMKQWFGYGPHELIGRPIELLIPERYHNQHVAYRHQYSRNPVARPMGRHLNLLARRKDGSEFPVDISLSPVKTESGVAITAFIRDITELKKVEDQQRFLSETSRILSETVDYLDRVEKIADLVVPKLSDICVVHLFEDGHLVPKALSFSDLQDPKFFWDLANNETVMRKNANYGPAFVGANQASQLLEEVTDEILEDIAADKANFQYLKSLKIQSYIGVPLQARGNLIGVVSFIRQHPNRLTKSDLAFAELVGARVAMALDNAKLIKDAQKAAHLREDVLAIVSHDLKNPLGVIEGFNGIIKETPFPTEVRAGILEASQAIDRSVRQMKKLIGDLLDFAQIQSGSLSVTPSSIPPHQLILEGIEAIHQSAERKQIRIQVEIPSHLPDVCCDSDRIRQVFYNILENSIKFSSNHSLIDIRASLNVSEVLFSVLDHGPGISKEHLPHLFDRYWQAKETAKLGTGLGLSIARGIINSHHGSIWAESNPGEGTTIHFTLPLSDSSTKCHLTAKPNSEQNSDSRNPILQ